MPVYRIVGGEKGPYTLLLNPGDMVKLEEGERVLPNVDLNFDQLRDANLKRLAHFPGHHGENYEPWTPNDWMVALTGEVGELANMLKKLRRGSEYPGMKMPTKEDIAGELADIQTYLDLLAARLGVDLGLETIRKFNQVSLRWGLDDRL